MEDLLVRALRPLRPRVGWVAAGVGLAAALCVPVAVGEGRLRLAVAPLYWAAVLGFGLGLWSAPATPDARGPLRRAGAALFWLLVVGLGAVLLALAAEGVLPPLVLIVQDAAAYAQWLWERLRGGETPAPLSRAAISFAETLPRFWQRLTSAPDAGISGARTLVGVGGVLLAWIGALLLGRELLAGRRLLIWQLPLLAAIALLTVFTQGAPFAIIGALAVLLLLVVYGEHRRHVAAWERSGTDYSEELQQGVLVGGVVTIMAVLLLAALLPAWLGNPLANLVWRAVETPSALAELERQANLNRAPPVAEIGLSNLPDLALGQSLEQGPPDQRSLRIQVSAPLPDTPLPHYWRARMFNIYTGRDWTTDARIATQAPTEINPDLLPGAIMQIVDDQRPDGRVLVALPDVIALDVATQVERLPDGTLTALTVDAPLTRYQVLSRPQEFASVSPLDATPTDMGAFLDLPQTVTSRVAALARRVAGDASSPYEQALQLEAYLRELPYSYQVTPLPAQGDAVDFFLFDSRTGYCTYYASAMAVMARSLGIPARVATGYFTGDYDPATQTYTVYENDAHAWPELFVDGRWLPFEPTPIRPTPARSSNQPPVVMPAPVPEAARGWNPAWLWLLALAGLAGLGGLWWWLRRARQPVPLVTFVQAQLERLGTRAGVAWPRGATLHEYGELLGPRLDGAATALRKLVTQIERVRYGGRALDAAEEGELRTDWEQVREQLENARREAS